MNHAVNIQTNRAAHGAQIRNDMSTVDHDLRRYRAAEAKQELEDRMRSQGQQLREAGQEPRRDHGI